MRKQLREASSKDAYAKQKKRLARYVNKFTLSDDLFSLAEAFHIVYDILREEKFPMAEYDRFSRDRIINTMKNNGKSNKKKA